MKLENNHFSMSLLLEKLIEYRKMIYSINYSFISLSFKIDNFWNFFFFFCLLLLLDLPWFTNLVFSKLNLSSSINSTH